MTLHGTRINELFHRLWTKAVGTADYDKPQWTELDVLIESQQRELNQWREIGDELGQAIAHMPREQFDDLFPDWFGPRLFDLQVKAKAHDVH